MRKVIDIDSLLLQDPIVSWRYAFCLKATGFFKPRKRGDNFTKAKVILSTKNGIWISIAVSFMFMVLPKTPPFIFIEDNIFISIVLFQNILAIRLRAA